MCVPRPHVEARPSLRPARLALCCLWLAIVPACDDGGAAAPLVDAPAELLPEDYTPPPEPGPEARAAFERGKALLAQGDTEAAINQFGQAVTLESRFAEAYLYRAKARDRQNAAALAMADAESAINHDSRLAEAYRLRAELYERRYYFNNDPADKQRADDDRKRYELLIGEEAVEAFGNEVDEAFERSLRRDP